MITRTYFNKINTIIKYSEYNNGINPVAEMIYGKSLTRILLHFDINHIKENIEDKTFADVEKIHHYLKLTNAGFVDFKNLHRKQLSKIDGTDKVRTSSFDLLFFLIPQEWDGGKGYDNAETLPNDLYITKFDNQAYNQLWLKLFPETHKYIWSYKQFSWKRRVELWLAAHNQFELAVLFQKLLKWQYRIKHA